MAYQATYELGDVVSVVADVLVGMGAYIAQHAGTLGALFFLAIVMGFFGAKKYGTVNPLGWLKMK